MALISPRYSPPHQRLRMLHLPFKTILKTSDGWLIWSSGGDTYVEVIVLSSWVLIIHAPVNGMIVESAFSSKVIEPGNLSCCFLVCFFLSYYNHLSVETDLYILPRYRICLSTQTSTFAFINIFFSQSLKHAYLSSYLSFVCLTLNQPICITFFAFPRSKQSPLHQLCLLGRISSSHCCLTQLLSLLLNTKAHKSAVQIEAIEELTLATRMRD